jgi:hypothetical protein
MLTVTTNHRFGSAQAGHARIGLSTGSENIYHSRPFEVHPGMPD